MRPWLLLLSLLVLSMSAVPVVETHRFKLPPQGHSTLFEGAPMYSYGTEWTVEVPAPSAVPSRVDIRELSTYVYKYIAFNLDDIFVAGGFQTPTWTTSFELEGIMLGKVVGGLDGLAFVLEPEEYFWGPGRPKVTDRVKGVVSRAGGWANVGGKDYLTLTVRAVSHFDLWSTGPLWFGQSLRQRIKGQIRYTY